jgi:hypothetical protein
LGGVPGVLNPTIPGNSGVGNASWQLNSDGSYTITGAAAGGWVSPQFAGIGAHWEVKVDPTSGTFSSGDSTGVWLSLSTNRAWNRTTPSTVIFTASFREALTDIVRKVQTGITLSTA